MIYFALLILIFPILKTSSEEIYYDEQMFLSARKFVTGVRSINEAKFNSTIVDPSKHSDNLCLRQVTNFAEELARGELWAVELYDSWTKLQFGLLDGNLVDFGLFNKCVKFRKDMRDDGVFQGQHCMTGFRANSLENSSTTAFLPRNLGVVTYGICLPAACSPGASILIANAVANTTSLQRLSQRCNTDSKDSLTILEKLIICFLVFYALFVISCTVYDVLKRNANERRHPLPVCFSAYTNGISLFGISENKNDIPSVHGVRFFSIVWLILGHRYLHQISGYNMNSKDFKTTWTQGYFSPFIDIYNISVDSFFLLSGVLIVNSFFREMKRNGRVNIFRMYLHRYLRITPALAMLILVQKFIRFFNDGPFYNGFTKNFQVKCDKYWWSALLHVQNYVNPLQTCLNHSWYLSVDMQLFWLSPLLLYPLHRYGRKFIAVIPILLALSISCRFAVSYNNDLRAYTSLMDTAGILLHKKIIYIATQTRMGPWLIGLLLGYVLVCTKERKFKINKTLNSCLWVGSISMIIMIVLLHHPLQQFENNSTTNLQNALYIAFYRNAFALGVAWIIFGCENGTGSVINWLLSRRLWQPIGRMGLSMYLVHVVLQVVLVGAQKQPYYFEDVFTVYAFWGDFMTTAILSALLFLMAEAPFVLVEKYFHSLWFAKRKTDEQ